MRSERVLIGLIGAVALGAWGCADSTGAASGARLSLAFSARPAPATIAASLVGTGMGPRAQVVQAGDETVVELGDDLLTIRSVELVLREIELKRADAAQCSTSGVANDDDGCEEFAVGIQLVSLPMGAALAVKEFQLADVPPGTYDQVEFEIHKPESSTDAAFISANPLFDGVSIRVTGSFCHLTTCNDFVYVTDLNKEQESQILLDVAAGETANVTLRIDISTWFVSADGLSLIDPDTANKGGPNEGVVKNNIEQSIEAFHDNDADGLDDVHEDDDHGTNPDHP